MRLIMGRTGGYYPDVIFAGPRGGKGDQNKGQVVKQKAPMVSQIVMETNSIVPPLVELKIPQTEPDSATTQAWPKVWDSGGTIPAFTNLREPKHEWGIHHYPVFQKAVNLGYPLHNFKVYVSDTDYFYSKFDPIKLYDWKNKEVLYENNRGTDALPSDVESDIRNVSMDYKNEPYFAQICSACIATFLCAISLDNLRWDDSTPKQITSIARYHLYYTMKKFIKDPCLMKAL
jgi:hypothetical protein